MVEAEFKGLALVSDIVILLFKIEFAFNYS